MWILRRRFEIWLLIFAALPLWVGFHLPPPATEVLSLAGPVERLDTSSDVHSIEFSVQGRRVSTSYLEPDYQRVRAAIREGSIAQVEAWQWLDQVSILELSLDGERVIRRQGRLLLYWVVTLAFGAFGGLSMGLAIQSFRNKVPLWERYLQGQRIDEEQRKQSKKKRSAGPSA
jgi:hypothetical protein